MSCIVELFADIDFFPDQSQHLSGPFSPVASKKGFGIATIVRQAASAASVAAKQAYAAASRNVDDEMMPLKCCLMSISLPWEHIAYDLLFKVNYGSFTNSSQLVKSKVACIFTSGPQVVGFTVDVNVASDLCFNSIPARPLG